MTTPTTLTMLDNLEAVLDERGLNRAAFARLMGHSPAWATRKLGGDRRWTIDELHEVAARLDLDPAALLSATRRYVRRVVAILSGIATLAVAR